MCYEITYARQLARWMWRRACGHRRAAPMTPWRRREIDRIDAAEQAARERADELMRAYCAGYREGCKARDITAI